MQVRVLFVAAGVDLPLVVRQLADNCKQSSIATPAIDRMPRASRVKVLAGIE